MRRVGRSTFVGGQGLNKGIASRCDIGGDREAAVTDDITTILRVTCFLLMNARFLFSFFLFFFFFFVFLPFLGPFLRHMEVPG